MKKVIFFSIFLTFFTLFGKAQEIFISEMTFWGLNTSIEIYNPGSQSVNLTGYSLRNSNNANPFPTDSTSGLYFSFNGIDLGPKSVYTIVNSGAPQEVQTRVNKVVTDQLSIPGDYVLHFFHDDAMGLFKNDSLIDLIGEEGVRQMWEIAGVDSATVSNVTLGGPYMITRKPYVTQGNTNWDNARGYDPDSGKTSAEKSEWIVSFADYNSLGIHYTDSEPVYTMDTVHYFVSPVGNDTNSGESPSLALKTIQAALERVRLSNRAPYQQLPALTETPPGQIIGTPDNYGDSIRDHSKTLNNPVVIHLMPGYHQVLNTILIDSYLGGNIHFKGEWNEGAYAEIASELLAKNDNPYSLKLPVDKIPVVSGGIILTGWKDTIINGVQAWVKNLPEVSGGSWSFYSLYVNGTRALRPRFPEVGSFRIAAIMPNTLGETTAFTDRVKVFPGDVSGSWRNLTDIVMIHTHRWVAERMNIVSFDPGSNTVTLGYIPGQDMNGSHPAHGAGLSAYYCENVYEECNAPGEWYLDRPTGNLFYIPREGEMKETSEVIAPKGITFFNITGEDDTNAYVWNVSFEKIAFMHNNSKVDRTPQESSEFGGFAIRAYWTRTFSVKSCFFSHLNDGAIRLGQGTMGAEVAGSYFRDLGSFGIGLSGSTNNTTTRSAYNNFHDNDIFGYGLFHLTQQPAISAGKPLYLTIEHNYIRYGFYNAINHQAHAIQEESGIGFGYKNIIRKNHIHTIGQGMVSDIGAIYLTGPQPGSVMEENLIYDVETRDYSGGSIYMDDNSAYWTVRKNVFFGSNLEVFHQKGFGHVNENNIFAYGALSSVAKNGSNNNPLPDPFGLGYSPSIFTKNIFIQNGGQQFFEDAEEPVGGVVPPDRKLNSDNNLFWNYSVDSIMMKEGMTLNQWRSMYNYDIYSLRSDPLFRDPFQQDFALKLDSPVLSLGFQSIDISDVGPRKSVFTENDAVWIDYPVKQPKTEFSPSDIPGIHMWITAKDIKSEKVAEWKDHTYNRYSMYQYYDKLMPVLNPAGLNGYPTVHFDGTQWMSTSHKSLEVSGYLAKFDKEDFTIFTVHSNSGNQPVFCKGNPGSSGTLNIGANQNNLKWGTNGVIGEPGEEFKVRTYQRSSGIISYFENSRLYATTSTEAATDFNENWVHSYLGRSASVSSNYLQGDIAEIIIYRGKMSEADRMEIENYLYHEWGLKSSVMVEKTTEIPSIVSVYPCPAYDTVQLNANGREINKLTIIDGCGRTLFRKKVNNTEAVIDISWLEPGYYSIMIYTTDGPVLKNLIKLAN